MRGRDTCVDMLSRSPMLDHDARLSMLKLGELMFRLDPEVIPKPPIKLAAIPGALTRPVPNSAADVPQHAELPPVSAHPATYPSSSLMPLVVKKLLKRSSPL